MDFYIKNIFYGLSLKTKKKNQKTLIFWTSHKIIFGLFAMVISGFLLKKNFQSFQKITF